VDDCLRTRPGYMDAEVHWAHLNRIVGACQKDPEQSWGSFWAETFQQAYESDEALKKAAGGKRVQSWKTAKTKWKRVHNDNPLSLGTDGAAVSHRKPEILLLTERIATHSCDRATFV
jgi:hypothetical protein